MKFLDLAQKVRPVDNVDTVLEMLYCQAFISANDKEDRKLRE